MSMLICCVNWEAVSAISNIVMATIAFMSLGVSFYLLHKERKQRIEDNRARIDFSIIKHRHGYYLCVENVGKVAQRFKICQWMNKISYRAKMCFVLSDCKNYLGIVTFKFL